MYLKYLQIVNYKNLKSVRFQFEKGTNTIIGANDTGKSNAMVALRMLLDDTFYYNIKHLKETDFSESLDDWRGHWIIISAFFDEITFDEKSNEACQVITLEKDKENIDFLKSYIRCEDKNFGTITLFIRPQKNIRFELASAKNLQEFKEIRSRIKLTDYEFRYTVRAQMDFINSKEYEKIVGNLDAGQYVGPDEDDEMFLGGRVDIFDVWKHISVVFIGALRDVENELHKPRNPIRKIMDTIQSDIKDVDVKTIKQKIRNLNKTISCVEQITAIGNQINYKLIEIVGLVYSPDIILESRLKDDLNSLARYLTMIPANKTDIDFLGLGHLNMIYVALKLVEFELNRTYELINIMIIEEPEAHIHTHIQKTLFENLKASQNYTQILMTTHSTHLSEVSDINKMNILKSDKNITRVMQPANGLDGFGKNILKLKVPVIKALKRYLDAKRSVLLFSRGVMLVEGDGEEIFLPHLVKSVLGVSLDELGIGLINIGSVGFENVACIFDEKRLQRYCSIITDEDIQIIGAKYFSDRAEKLGKSRKEKLDELFKSNMYVNVFYAYHTLEVDFANEVGNTIYIAKAIDKLYLDKGTIAKYKKNLKGDAIEIYDTVLSVANSKGKGWYSTILSETLDVEALIPNYIIEAIAFACQEVLNQSIVLKMIKNSLGIYNEECKKTQLLTKQFNSANSYEEKDELIFDYCEQLPDDMVSILINANKKYKRPRG